MKLAALAFVASLAVAVEVAAAATTANTDGSPGLTLRGIIRWPGRQLAILENTNAAAPWERDLVLGPNERAGQVEVFEVMPTEVKLRLADSGRDLTLHFADSAAAPGTETVKASIQLENAPASSIFRVYQELADRTVLRSSRLQNFALSLPLQSGSTKQDLLRALNDSLAKAGIVVQACRDKFVLAANKEAEFQKVAPGLWDLASGLAGTNKDEILLAGLINFPNTDLSQALSVVQELANRTVIRATTLPLGTIVLRTQTLLSRAEAIYAFIALLALDELSLTAAGDKFLVIFLSFQKESVEALLARTKLREDGGSALTGGTIRLSGANLRRAADLYGQISCRPVEIGISTPRPALLFESQGPLTKAEVLYGLELLLGINGLSVSPKQDGPGLVILPTAAVK